MTHRSVEKHPGRNKANSLIRHIQNEIQILPPTELSYYLALLLASIKNEPKPWESIELLKKVERLTKEIQFFYFDEDKSKNNLERLILATNDLIKASAMQSISHQTKRALLAISGIVLSIIYGVTGALLGLAAGLFSNYNLVGNVKGAGLGFIAGLALGVLTGYRMPVVALQSRKDTKIEFCIDNLTRLREELKDRKTIEDYQRETKQYILETFFKDTPLANREQVFKNFLDSWQAFQVCTTTAGHISPSLKGHLGHHTLIRFKINNVADVPLEFGDRAKTPNFVDQSEKPRKVRGQKLFDMLVLDRRLQDTHESNIRNAVRIYNIGSDDCRTYVDKILIGTGQAPTKIGRFSDKDSLIGRSIVAPTVRFFSRTREDELHSLIDNPDDPKFDISHHRYPEKKMAVSVL